MRQNVIIEPHTMRMDYFKVYIWHFLRENGLQGMNIMRDCVTDEIYTLEFKGSMSLHFPPFEESPDDMDEVDAFLYDLPEKID